MLKQLASREGISEYTREAFQEARKEFGGRGLRLPNRLDILKKTITSLPRDRISPGCLIGRPTLGNATMECSRQRFTVNVLRLLNSIENTRTISLYQQK